MLPTLLLQRRVYCNVPAACMGTLPAAGSARSGHIADTPGCPRPPPAAHHAEPGGSEGAERTHAAGRCLRRAAAWVARSLQTRSPARSTSTRSHRSCGSEQSSNTHRARRHRGIRQESGFIYRALKKKSRASTGAGAEPPQSCPATPGRTHSSSTQTPQRTLTRQTPNRLPTPHPRTLSSPFPSCLPLPAHKWPFRRAPASNRPALLRQAKCILVSLYI